MNEVQSDGSEPNRSGASMQTRVTWFFALAALLFLALWAWTELRLRAEREITRLVEAERSVLEGEARRSGLREQLRGRRTGIALPGLSVARMSAAEESVESRGRVYVDGNGGRVFAFFQGLEDPRPGMTYQLWFRPVDDPPESIGTVTFDEEGDGIVTYGAFRPDHVNGEFVLTLEPAGGALVPTGPDVLRGRLESSPEAPPEEDEADESAVDQETSE